MKKITLKQWKECLPCYKRIKKGQKWMLYNEKGMTVWGPVEIKANAIGIGGESYNGKVISWKKDLKY